MLAYLRGDTDGLASILDDVGPDVMPFVVGMAAQAKALADMTEGLALWQRYLDVTVAKSADLAVDPDAQGRIARGQV